MAIIDKLRNNLRASDDIFRLGDDDFLLFFPNTRLNLSGTLVKRLMSHLQPQVIDNLTVGFNYGFAEYRPGTYISAEELIIAVKKFETYTLKKGSCRRQQAVMINSDV